MRKLKVAVLGATGVVGQVFLWMLSRHKWFEAAYITASSQRQGKLYGEEVNWLLPYALDTDSAMKEIKTLDYSELEKEGIKIVFSALPADIALKVEPELREKGFYVFSNASAMRYEEDVPILIPEVNKESLKLIEKQGFPEKGFVITNANCSTTGLAAALAPLRKFDIREIFVSTYQSVSGAGYPGLPVMDIMNNAVPFINKEEEKMKIEIKKILEIEPEVYPFCVRIPVNFGHLEAVWVGFNSEVSEEQVIEAWKAPGLKGLQLPSLPVEPIIYNTEDDFPQPKISFWGDPPGMPLFTGRVRKEEKRIGFVLVVNNLVKGAAGGSIVNAECFIESYGDLF